MKIQTKITLLTLMVLCETGCFFISPYSISASTIIYTVAGIAISILPLIIGIRRSDAPIRPDKYSRYTYILYIAAVLLICNWISNTFRIHIHTSPIDRLADMLLFIKEMSERYLAHQPVYDPISDIHGFPVQAVYLPGFWLPYTIPISLGMDMRWLSLFAFIGVVLIASVSRPRDYRYRYLLLLPPIALLSYVLLDGAAFYFMHTQEAVVMLYMAILAWALTRENWIIAGIAAAGCLLSRYYIAVPLVLGVMWLYTVDTRAARRAALSAIVSIIAILTITRTWGDIGYFCRIPFLYVGLLNAASSYEAFRHIYYRSVGFASFFDLPHMHIITTINMVFLFSVPTLYFLFAYYFLRSHTKSTVILCGIKIFLVFFLTTLAIPFGYVVYTSSLVSIMLLRNVLVTTSRSTV